MSGSPAVRVHPGRMRFGLRNELDATVPLLADEEVLLEWRITRGGPWIQRHGYLRVTDRRVLILSGRWLGRNEVIEIPRSLVQVRPAVADEPMIRLEIGDPAAAREVDDDLLAFRAFDWATPRTARGITLRVHAETERTRQLHDLLVLALGEADGPVPEERR